LKGSKFCFAERSTKWQQFTNGWHPFSVSKSSVLGEFGELISPNFGGKGGKNWHKTFTLQIAAECFPKNYSIVVLAKFIK
jgi:hypothetical protein